MSEYKSFEINIAGREISLQLGKCAVALFRRQGEVSYIAVDIGTEEEELTLRIFNNPEFAYWLAGYKPTVQEDEMQRPTFRQDFNGVQSTFRELTGWNPSVVEREHPNERELEMWTDVNTEDMEDGLREILGG